MANSMMKVGGVGCIIWLAGIILVIIGFLSLITGLGSRSATAPQILETWALITAVGMIIFTIGIVVTSIGVFGLWKQYKSRLSMIAGFIGLIAGTLGFVYMFSFFVSGANGAEVFMGAVSWLWILQLGFLIATATFLILFGTFLILPRTRSEGIAQGTGITALIIGIMIVVMSIVQIGEMGIALLIYLISLFLMIPTMGYATKMFFKA